MTKRSILQVLKEALFRYGQRLGREVARGLSRGVTSFAEAAGRGLAFGLVAAVFFAVLPRVLPSGPEQPTQPPVDIAIYEPLKTGRWSVPTRLRTLRFEAVPRSAVDDEFRLGISLSGAGGQEVAAVLSAPATWSARSISNCQNRVVSSQSGACSAVVGDVGALSWTVTATKPGRYLYDVQMLGWTPPSGAWFAYARTLPEGSYLSDDGSVFFEEVVLVRPIASASTPVAKFGAGAFDVSTGRFSGEMRVTNSLGLTPRTYAILSVVGVVLTTLFGSAALPLLLQFTRRARRPDSGAEP